ncbi:hypothetical protein NDU88_002660 [Pleurodeles waltl]|uniref:Uncharacterized protein n=1 Tax=Pleurodeles waltl TaxID=8319 RepID=A0AAV7LGD9_PLEWA|nr:hypothetical protein NDU88_002660 [Pleurodeles waltl]
MLQASPPVLNQPAITTPGPTNKAQHLKVQSGPTYPRDPASGPNGQRHNMYLQGPPHPDKSSDPGGPPASTQTAQRGRHARQTKRGAGSATQAARPPIPGCAPQAGAVPLSLGGWPWPETAAKGPPQEALTTRLAPAGQQGLSPATRVSARKCTPARMVKQASAVGPPPAQPAPCSSPAATPKPGGRQQHPDNLEGSRSRGPSQHHHVRRNERLKP